MSLETKVSFLHNLERTMSQEIAASVMDKVLSMISDELQHYDLEQTETTTSVISFDFFDAYLAAMKVQGRSPKTLDRYQYLIKRVLNEINTPVRNITVHHLRSWFAKEKARGIADSTLEGNRQVLSGFFGWLWREGLIEKNPLINLGTIKCQKKVKEAYEEVDIEKLKAACSDPRNMALLTILLSTGCRISEITQLNRDDINFHDHEIVVLGKGNKERTVFMDDIAAMRLTEYLETRKDDNPALFLNKNHQRIQPGGVRFMLKNLAAAAGITTKVHPHKFRRTLATTLIAHGMPIQEVAAILGHEKLDTTMRYVVMDKSAVKSSYKKYA